MARFLARISRLAKSPASWPDCGVAEGGGFGREVGREDGGTGTSAPGGGAVVGAVVPPSKRVWALVFSSCSPISTFLLLSRSRNCGVDEVMTSVPRRCCQTLLALASTSSGSTAMRRTATSKNRSTPVKSTSQNQIGCSDRDD